MKGHNTEQRIPCAIEGQNLLWLPVLTMSVTGGSGKTQLFYYSSTHSWSTTLQNRPRPQIYNSQLLVSVEFGYYIPLVVITLVVCYFITFYFNPCSGKQNCLWLAIKQLPQSIPGYICCPSWYKHIVDKNLPTARPQQLRLTGEPTWCCCCRKLVSKFSL